MNDPIVFPSQVSARLGNATIHTGDCRAFLESQIAAGIRYDAVITDPPYEIALHGKAWDNTGIAFDTTFWTLVLQAMKPGAYLMAFTASRLYHRVAVAVEDAGFRIYPALQWQFAGGLQKPVNVSELFDRDNIPDRQSIGTKTGSGFTAANAKHGAQQRLTKEFKVYARGVSQEAKDWMGHYYGMNCFRPCYEPIVLAQKPIDEKRMIDNIRAHGTGSLNLGALNERQGGWPTPVFTHNKARPKDHGSDHPSVKPVPLMEDLCLAGCPKGGHILDPFAGTGTTGLAAIRHGFDCTLVEQNPEMRAVIERRLGDA